MILDVSKRASALNLTHICCSFLGESGVFSQETRAESNLSLILLPIQHRRPTRTLIEKQSSFITPQLVHLQRMVLPHIQMNTNSLLSSLHPLPLSRSLSFSTVPRQKKDCLLFMFIIAPCPLFATILIDELAAI